jgi:hypothetical protein
MHSGAQSWENKRLWQLIQDRAQPTDPSPLLVKNVMPKIERVLAKGGTAPMDFTLHDEEHAFRVAQRMVELLPDDVADKLGTFELGLLLLSAYLHDIGMTPARDVVKRHYQYILTKENGLLSDAEVSDLQNWLDEAREGLELPIAADKVTVAGLEQAEELLAYYCRHRHNDWSEHWTRRHLKGAIPLYPGWIDDLVTLCRSHHEGLEALRQERFRARHRGSPAQVINLRYLAAVLRVSDVMEFDPERTPDIIIAPRDIASNSRVYWYKDRFSFVFDRNRPEFRLDATTPDAKVHRAVLETVQQVDQELLICNALESSGALMLGSFKDHRCCWPWPAKVNAEVTSDGSFVYIDGVFRPDPQHILKLLGGVALYQDPMVAVRELLQNAFDAVKEQIARERLQKDDPGDPSWERMLGDLHKVRLSVVQADDGVWLVCDDDGVGMTRSIIERHLLVSGAPTLPDIHKLEREARAHGFGIGRSAKFGIGVLSYFMIADRMAATTRRSDLAGGDPDNTGWQFETEGLGWFGQLTKHSRAPGTQVRLRIASHFTRDLRRLKERIFTSVKSFLAYLPCTFELLWLGKVEFSLCRGWCRTMDHFSSRFVNQLDTRSRSGDPAFLPIDEIRKREEEDARLELIRHAVKDRLRYAKAVEKDLPDQIGRYRAQLFYFALDGGASLAFLDVHASCGELLIDSAHLALPRSLTLHSWNGFELHTSVDWKTEYAAQRRLPLTVEIDWSGTGQISADRQRLDIEASILKNATQLILQDAASICTTFLEEHSSSRYATLNRAAVKSSFHNAEPPLPKAFWAVPSTLDRKTRQFAWDKLAFPAIEIETAFWSRELLHELRWRGQRLAAFMPLKLPGHSQYISTLEGIPCDRISFVPLRWGAFRVVPLWEREPADNTAQNLPWLADFPEEWSQVCLVSTQLRVFWNRGHALIRAIRADDWRWVTKYDRFDVTDAGAILNTRSRAAAWTVRNLVGGDQRAWNGLRDQLPEFFVNLVGKISDLEEIYCVVYDRFYEGSFEVWKLWKGGVKVIDAHRVVGPGGKLELGPDESSIAMPSRPDWWVQVARSRDE